MFSVKLCCWWPDVAAPSLVTQFLLQITKEWDSVGLAGSKQVDTGKQRPFDTLC